MKSKKFLLPLAIVTLGIGFIAHAESSRTAKSAPPKADADMQKVLDALAALHGKPIETLSPNEARAQPTPADAVKKVLQAEGKSVSPVAVGSIKDISIPGSKGQIPLKVYSPEGSGPFPVIVYFHGGGFVIASSDVYDSSIRALVHGARAVVVSVDYHRAPEYKFPTQANEAYTAYKWVLDNASQVNGDAKRVAVAGESAGGNLAAVVSLMARDHGDALPVHQLLIYPVVDDNMSNPSYKINANAKPLNRDMMQWFFNQYVTQKSDATSEYALPNKAKTLKGLPSATVITAEIDPLMSEGKAFAQRLEREGIPVAYKHYDGVTHEFFGMDAVVAKAKEAQAFASEQLKKAFNT